MYHRELLRCLGDLRHGRVDLSKKRRRRVVRAGEIPFKGLRDFGTCQCPNADHGHLSNPCAELVAESSPRNACVRIGIGLRFAGIQFDGKRWGQRRGSDRVETIPQSAHECDALFGGEGLKGLRSFSHIVKLATMPIHGSACLRGHNASAKLRANQINASVASFRRSPVNFSAR